MMSLQLSVATFILYLSAMGSGQMNNVTSTDMDTIPTEVTDPSNAADMDTMDTMPPDVTGPSNAADMDTMDTMPPSVTDIDNIGSMSTDGPSPSPSLEPNAEETPLLLPAWAIAFIVVGGVFLVLAVIAAIGMCVGIATKSR